MGSPPLGPSGSNGTAMLPPPGAEAVADDEIIAIPGQLQTANVTVSATRPATGELAVPDQQASGGISFANTADVPVTLPAGTEIVSDGGIAYALDVEVTVPAATERASGNADGSVTAVDGGTAGNLGQGALSGRHESGVFFSNRNGALSGGTNRMVTVVSEDDLALANADLEEFIPVALANVLSESTGTALAVAPGSVTHAELEAASSVDAGQEATEFTVTASTTATGLAFDTSTAQDALLTEATASVDPPDGVELDMTDAEITFGPSSDGSNNGATAIVLIWQVADLDDSVIDALPDDLARLTVDEAQAEFDGIDGVESSSIEIRPDWLPSSIRDQMPILPQRIEVREE